MKGSYKSKFSILAGMRVGEEIVFYMSTLEPKAESKKLRKAISVHGKRNGTKFHTRIIHRNPINYLLVRRIK